MAHIQSKLLKLWKPQNLTVDKISSQKMFIDNIDALESFGLSVLKRTDVPVASITELRAVDTSDTSLYTDGMMIMVKSNGLYFFNRSSTETDDGKNVIAPTNGGGRWISDFSFLGSMAFKNSLSASDVGLGNVPNVTTNDQTPTYTQASSLTNIASGEKLSVSMGKIMKAISDLISHKADKTNPHGVTKSQVGLGNVDNTSDMDKPVSTAQQNAINAAAGSGSTAIEGLNTHKADKTNPHGVTASQVGLGNVNNTADTDKPVSTAQAAAIADAKKAGNDAQTNINAHTANKSNPHGVTASQVGLGNVPNVATNDQTPTYTQASTLANLVSGEKLSVSMGKIMKLIADVISHLANKSNPHTVTAAQVNAVPVSYSQFTSTTDEELDSYINTTFNDMSDNTVKIVKINFSMQHEFFVDGTSAVITIYKSAQNYGNLIALTQSGATEIFVRSRYNSTTWGNWVNRNSVLATASVVS